MVTTFIVNLYKMNYLFICVIVIILWWIYWLWTRRKIYALAFKVRGPLGYPFIGSAYQFRRKEDLLQRVTLALKEYGDTFFLFLGTYPVLVITNPFIIKEVLNSPYCINKSLIYGVLDRNIGKGLISLEDPLWSLHRKAFNSAFSNKILQNFIPLYNEKANELLHSFQTHIEGELINFIPIIQRYTLEISIQTMMGNILDDMTNSVNNTLLQSYHCLLDSMTDQIFAPWLQLRIVARVFGLQQKLDIARSNIQQFIKKLIERKISSKSSDYEEINCFAQVVINLFKKGILSWSNVEIECNTIMLAAFETTANSIMYTLILLAMHPTYQEKLFDELVSIFPKANDFYITNSNLHDLVYLDLILNESMRVITPVPLVARQTTKEIHLSNDLKLPAGIQIAIDIFHLHRRSDIWGLKADQFNPDNFLPSNLSDKHSYSFIPFTKGIRNCIGWRQALILTKVTLAKLLRNYRFSTDFKYEDLDFIQDISIKLKTIPMLQIHSREDNTY